MSSVGDGATVELLTASFVQHRRRLRRQAQAIVRSPEGADDIVQQAYVNTMAAIGRGVQIANLEAWLTTCVKRLAIEQIRAAHSGGGHEQLDRAARLDARGLQCAELADLRDRWHTVERAVDTLPDHYREAFLLAEVRGLGYNEIGTVMNRSLGSVRQILLRAREQVRDLAESGRLQLGGLLWGIHDLSRSRQQHVSLRARMHDALAPLHNWLGSVMGRAGDFLSAPAASLMVATLVVSVQLAPGREVAAPHGSKSLAAASATDDVGGGRSGVPGRAGERRHRTGPVAPPANPSASRPDSPDPAARSQPSQSDGSDATGSAATAGSGPRPAAEEHDSSSGTAGFQGWASVGYDGDPPNDESSQPAAGQNATVVAFASTASNLVPNDQNAAADVFLRDLETDGTTLVSQDSSGQPGNGPSGHPAITADGEIVAFSSAASNLVSGDGNRAADVFVRNVSTGNIERISVASSTEEGNGDSYDPTLSADGRFVAFTSTATNLANYGAAAPAVDRGSSGGTVDSAGGPGGSAGGPGGSAGGPGGSAGGPGSSAGPPGDSADGPGDSPGAAVDHADTNGASDVYLHDRLTKKTVQVSVSPDGDAGTGASSEPAVSADGRVVAFRSTASNLLPGDGNGTSDIYLYVRDAGVTVRVSRSATGGDTNGESREPSIGGSGRFVAYSSLATNVADVDGDSNWDGYAYDRVTGSTTLLSQSHAASGGPALAADCTHPVVAANGRTVAFECHADPAAAAGSSSGVTSRVLVRNTATGEIHPVTRGTELEDVPLPTRDPAIDPSGAAIAYVVNGPFSTPTGLDWRGLVFAQSLS